MPDQTQVMDYRAEAKKFGLSYTPPAPTSNQPDYEADAKKFGLAYAPPKQPQAAVAKKPPAQPPVDYAGVAQKFGVTYQSPQEKIFQATVGEGQSEERARLRVNEYDYAIKQGLSPERAEQFALSMNWREAPRKVYSDEEKKRIADWYGSLSMEERQKGGVDLVTDPQQFAEGFAQGRAMGMDEDEAYLYGRSQPAVRAYLRGGRWIGSKWRGVKTSVLGALGVSEPEERAENPMFGTAQEQRAHELTKYRTADWFDKHLGKVAGALDSHLFGLVDSFSTPGMLALEVASVGLGGATKLLPEVGEEINLATKATRLTQRTLRTTQQLAHAGFMAQMAGGTAEAGIESFRQFRTGNYSEGIGYAFDALISGLMVAGGFKAVDSAAKVHTDLDAKAREIFQGKDFNKLSDKQQALTIQKLIDDDSEYAKAAAASQKEMRKGAKRLQRRYGEAMGQAWNANAAQRAVNAIQAERAEAARVEQIQKEIDTLKAKVQKRTEEIQKEAAESAEFLGVKDAAVKEARAQERREAAASRAAVRQTAEDIAKGREETFASRQAIGETPTEEESLLPVKLLEENPREIAVEFDLTDDFELAKEIARKNRQANLIAQAKASQVKPARHVEAEADDTGHVTYPAQYWGETNRFGVGTDGERHSVYRQTPRGVEWLDRNGNFTETPESLYFNADPQVSDTVARLSSLKLEADGLAAQPEATAEQVKEADTLGEIRRQLIEGEINATEAQKRAGIAEKVRLPDLYMAAREGRLNGPFNERSATDYAAEVESELRESGASEEEIQATLESLPELARVQTEANLHHVYQPGDYIISKRGVKWTLDAKGILHSSDGETAPLMKRGTYSNQAMQLAASGRVGYGTKTRQERRADFARNRDIKRQISIRQEEFDREMRLAQQNAGLETAGVIEPSAREAERGERGPKFLGRPPVPEDIRKVRAERKAAYKASTDPNNIINQLAKQFGVTPDEVMRIGLSESMPKTPEGKAASLEVGDRVSDPFKPDRPWIVEEKRGQLYLRSGQANPLPFDRLNPSPRVLQILERGEVTHDRDWTAEEKEKVAFEKPYLVHQRLLADGVKERIGKPVPEPKTQKEAETQVVQAEARKDATASIAVNDAVAAMNPEITPNETPEKTEEKAAQLAEKAAESKKLVRQAIAQSAKAQGKAAPKGDFPALYPMPTEGKGMDVVITQGEESHPAHYYLVKLRGIITSHNWNENRIEVDPRYTPRGMQKRIFDAPKTEEVFAQAGLDKFRLADFLQAYNGPERGVPILEEGGRAIGGNTRLLRLKKWLENVQAQGGEAADVDLATFRDEVRKFARGVGIKDPPMDEEIYVPVRILDDPIRTIEKAVQLGSLFNDPTSSQVDEAVEAVTHANYLKEAEARELGEGKPGILTEIGRAIAGDSVATVRQAIDANPFWFAQVAKDYFHIPDTQNSEWFENADGGRVLSLSGKNKFELALLSTHIPNAEAVAKIVNTAPAAALGKAIGTVTALKAFPDRDISGKISEAVQAVIETSRFRAYSPTGEPGDKPGVAWAKAYMQNLPGFGEEAPPEPDIITRAIYQAMLDRKTTRLNNALKDLIAGQAAGMDFLIAPEARGKKLETAAELFNAAFEPELKEIAFQEGKKGFEVTQNEFDAALRGQDVSDEERAEEKKPEPEVKVEEIPKFGKPPTVEPIRQGSRVALVSDPSVTGTVTYEEYGKARVRFDNEPKERIVSLKELSSAEKRFGPPPKAATPEAVADRKIAEAKTEQGYVTPQQLREFLDTNPVTKDHASELMRTAQMMAEFVYDSDPPIGVDKKQALDWILRERIGRIEEGERRGVRGEYVDPRLEKGLANGILRLHKAADPTSFIHEFAHVIFPFLSDEDLKAIDTIGDKRVWDGTPGSLRGDTYVALSEKLAGGMERFLRDQNPRDFNDTVGAVLAKIKEIFRRVYMQFRKDPLAPYTLGSDSVELFDKMFHIEGSEMPDDWREAVKKARAAEKKIVKPEEQPHPVVTLARELGGTGLRESIDGKVVDEVGDAVDDKKPTVVIGFPSEAAAVAGVTNPKVKGGKLIQANDGTWAVKINTPTKVPRGSLFQSLQERELGLQLEDLEKRLRDTPSYKTFERRLVQDQIDRLKARIRTEAGLDEPGPQSEPELPKQVVQEAKRAKEADRGRAAHDDTHGLPQPPRVGGIPKPPQLGVSGYATSKRGGPTPRSAVPRAPVSLENVKPVTLQPLTGVRGEPVGTIAGEKFDQAAWVEGLKRSGVAEGTPPPTWSLDPKTAAQLIYPGQKQNAQTIQSAIRQGDGVVVVTPPRTGKTWLAGATIREWLSDHPNANILFITKNKGLLKKFKRVAANSFGFDVELDAPTGENGVYAASYMKLLKDATYKNTKWDLVISDEAGEARRWYDEDTQQGQMLKDVVANSEKAVYMSATPFHSPMEYGYLDKLNLWPKGQFDKWIQENFAHEKIGDKIVARLDPAKQMKLREQLIERGQMVSQAISYDGYNAHFGVVPVTDSMKRGLDRIREGFDRARDQLSRMGKTGLARRAAAFEAVYTKNFLERERLPQTIELAKKGREQGWRVLIFSEHTADDLFRRERQEGEDPSTYQQLDDAMGGQLSKIIPPYPSIYNELYAEFGEQVGDYSGSGNTDAEREASRIKFLKGEIPILYSSYAGGGIGVDMHDADFPEYNIKGGDKPILAIYMGPPYSGVLLEQAMGRPWGFGSKSDVHAVFLATDSEPDIRLMQTKVGPRMKALRAAVLGEKDSLANVMSTYTDEEKVRERQDQLAYAEGNEMKVNASQFQVRSKQRNVGIQDWSAITFPSAETAKHKGMKYGEAVAGGDWSSLYQSKFELRPPDSPESARAKNAIDRVANKAAQNPDIPREAIATSAARAAETSQVAPAGMDKEAAGRMSVEAGLNAAGYFQDPLTGEWKIPHELAKKMMGDDVSGIDERDARHYTVATLGMNWTQRAISTARTIGAERQVRDAINRVAGYYTTLGEVHGDLDMGLIDIHKVTGLNLHDEEVMREVWDVKEGKRSSADPKINEAATWLTDWTKHARDLAEKNKVSFTRADGTRGTYADIKENPTYLPHYTDWDLKLTDPQSGNTKTLKEVTNDRTIDDTEKLKYFESKRKELGASEATARQWLSELKEESRGRMRGPTNPHITKPRVMNHPFYRKDLWALRAYAQEMASAIAVEKEFGTDMKDLRKDIARIPNRMLREDFTSGVQYIFEHQDWNTRMGQFVRAGQGYAAITKMTLSPVSVLFHGIQAITGLGGRVGPVAKSVVRSFEHPIKFAREKYYLGVVSQRMNPWLLEGGRPGLAGWYFEWSGFNRLYAWTRSIVGDSAKIWMEQDSLADLKAGGKREAEARRILNNRMLIGNGTIDQAIVNGKWDTDSINRAQRAFADYAAYSENPFQMPRMARLRMPESGMSDAEKNLHAAVHAAYTMKSFAIKTYSNLRETLYDEVVVHGNLKPLAPFVLLFPIAGQALLGTKATIKTGIQKFQEDVTGRPHKHTDLDTWLEQFNIAGHPWTGALKIYLDGLFVSIANETLKRWGDFMLDELAGRPRSLLYTGIEEAEQKAGTIYADLAEFLYNEWKIGDEYRKIKNPRKKTAALIRDEAREAERIYPILRDFPMIEGLAYPKGHRGIAPPPK